MKLKLKHLAPYFTYDLKVYVENLKRPLTVICLNKSRDFAQVIYDDKLEGKTVIGFKLQHIKPILRPLSDLPKFIEIEGKKVCLKDKLKLFNYINESLIDNSEFIQKLPYYKFIELFEYHFDVFGLIPAGLAVSIHDVGQAVA